MLFPRTLFRTSETTRTTTPSIQRLTLLAHATSWPGLTGAWAFRNLSRRSHSPRPIGIHRPLEPAIKATGVWKSITLFQTPVYFLSLGSYTVGLIFWLSWKKLVGSYLFLRATSRLWLTPYEARTCSSPSSPRKFVYTPLSANGCIASWSL